MIKKWSIRYPSATGWQKRRVYVYLPVDYEDNPDRHYPVLYMFDGQNLFWDSEASFDHGWNLGRYLNRTRTPLIVAAIECNPDPENARLSEYCPFDWTDPKLGFFKGRGEKTMNWYINRFKPYIDSHFRTLPERENTYIGGSSMGGLMSLYAVTVHNDVYSRAAVLSPTLDADIDLISEFVRESDIGPDTVVYMDYGSSEFDYEPFQPNNFTRISLDLFEKGIFLSTRIVPYGTHSEESWERQMPFAIPTLLY